MKRFFLLAMAAATVSNAAWPDSLAVTGQINLQAQKFLGPSDKATQETDNNLDQWYGEAILGFQYQNGAASSGLEVTMYPVGFGVQPREVTYFPDSAEQKAAAQRTDNDQVRLSEAWVGYALPFGGIEMKLGRFTTNLAQGTGMYGNYVDQNPSGDFKSREATHNALELSMLMNKFYMSLMAQSTDEHLNTGRIRAQFSYYAPQWGVDLAFRNNALDKFRSENNSLSQTRIHAGANVLLAPSFKVYSEAGLILNENEDNGTDKERVLLVGVTIPTAKFLDNLALECEISPDRTVQDDKDKEKDKPVLLNLQLTKAISTATLLDVAVFSDPIGASFGDVGMAVRLQANLW